MFVDELRDYLVKIKNEYKKEFFQELNLFKQSNIPFQEFYQTTKVSPLTKELYKCSPKMTQIMFYSFMSPGKVIIYSSWVIMEGLQIMKIYLELCGIECIEYHGSLGESERAANKDLFNSSDNIRGESHKALLLGPAGKEGLTLTNVRQIHMIEPTWHETDVQQIKGRGIRYCVHKDLPIEERTVHVYRHIVRRLDEKSSMDEQLYSRSVRKQRLISSYLNAMKSAAVDCQLNQVNNMKNQPYMCFRNDENIIDMVNDPGPSYKTDLEQDIKHDNGLFAENTQIVDIKVVRVKVIDTSKKIITADLDNDTGNIYDIENDNLIGRVEKAGVNFSQDEKGNYILARELVY
jgi:hypothetical protein